MKLRPYNREELFKTIDQISITKTTENQVITKFGNRVVNVTNVSDKYEVFDISKYLKDKIDVIEQNFEIKKYELRITKGVQYLRLISDSVEINGSKFQKSFYIINSSDKSRRLSFNVGLHSDKFYLIRANNASIFKKHLKGVTEAAEVASSGITGESFDEQINSLQDLVGHRVLFSKIRQVILGDKEDVPQINHRKFDAFKNSVRFASSDKLFSLTESQKSQLYKTSESLNEIKDDFYIDAFWSLGTYLSLFSKQDSHIIKVETDRIMKITQWAVRNNMLEALGI
jgi:hypothetical protein